MLSTKPNRRSFLKQVAATALAAATPAPATLASQLPQSSASPVGSGIKNRLPLTPNAFYSLPLGAIRPTGWLLNQLRIQANGLGGHLDETWPDVGPTSGWLGGTGESWERGPYFVDGLLPLAYLLDDDRLKAKATRYIEWTLTHQASDGMIGPATNNDWWPRMVMLKVLIQYQEATGDPRVIPLLARYFQHQIQTLPTRPLVDWGKFRWQDNALSVLWLYNRTGDPSLLALVRLLHRQGFDWQAHFSNFQYTQPVTRESIKLAENGLSDLALSTHGVNNGQAVKAAPLWYLLTGIQTDRGGIDQMLHALDTFHGLPNGMFSCDEHLAGRNPSQGSELCTVVETMFSLEQSIAILGNAPLGDRLETLAYNALPGTFTDDMWAHQYNQQPNQVEVGLHTKPWTSDGPESNLFGLAPNFGCCTANFHQGWPKFAASLWMASHDDGLAAIAYAPCAVTTTVRGIAIQLIEETEYPFRDSVRITLKPAQELRFPLRVRIPGWAEGTTLRVNGKEMPVTPTSTFTVVDRLWKSGDVVTLTFPLKPRLVQGFNQSVSVHRGPLVFSLPIGEDWVKLRDRGMTADWQIFPTTQWNYALIADKASQPTAIEAPFGSIPFSRTEPPIKLTLAARKLPDWRSLDGVAAEVPASPVASTEPEEQITLIPYAAAKLRITSFPTTG